MGRNMHGTKNNVNPQEMRLVVDVRKKTKQKKWRRLIFRYLLAICVLIKN
jgi:hypothetical protein